MPKYYVMSGHIKDVVDSTSPMGAMKKALCRFVMRNEVLTDGMTSDLIGAAEKGFDEDLTDPEAVYVDVELVAEQVAEQLKQALHLLDPDDLLEGWENWEEPT